MAITSNRKVYMSFSGDVNAPALYYSALANIASPGIVNKLALLTGFNSIAVPTGATGITIIPPSGNLVTLTLKGVTGDRGVDLHLTDPSSFGITGTQATIGITAGNAVTVLAMWT